MAARVPTGEDEILVRLLGAESIQLGGGDTERFILVSASLGEVNGGEPNGEADQGS